jgi:putative flippase GtrA
VPDPRPSTGIDDQRGPAVFIRFLAAGGLAAVVNFGSRFLFDVFVPFSVAIVLAFVCGLTAGFLLNKRFVFTTSTQSTAVSAAWFTAVNLFALIQTWVVTMGLARLLFPAVGFEFHPEAVAHAAGIIVPVFTSYVGHKHLTFKATA